MSDEKHFHKVATVGEIPRNTGKAVTVNDDELAIFNLNGEYYAIGNMCPHRGAALEDGFVEQDKVFCPWHCFDFNLKTGECTTVPSLRVPTYEVKVEGEEIFILH